MIVVVGIIALLIAILLPPLRFAHRQALAARCGVQLQQIGIALESAKNEYDVYPLWDDVGSPTRYTWIDVLIQREILPSERIGYCPEDPRPSDLNAARGRHYQVTYPGSDTPGATTQFGVDYSYGIAVPLSSAGWKWQSGYGNGDERPRRLQDYERYPAQRVLAADSNWTYIYNLSGDSLFSHDWSFPTQYDNTVAYRHRGPTANILFQDGHVSRIRYQVAEQPVDTGRIFVWHAGEDIHVGPEDQHFGNYYPNQPPLNMHGEAGSEVFPSEMVPRYYTSNMLWTQILNK